MLFFDFQHLLPALLHVEDRVSMSHGLESRVPFLDHPLIEYINTIPPEVKFQNGSMKNLIRQIANNYLPQDILSRTDKKGFPVPINQWMKGPLREFVNDIFVSKNALHRGFYNTKKVLHSLNNTQEFSRKLWGLMSLEVWYQTFIDEHTID
jgi:asparagine synthase (glutamine-hydrolysing)